MAIVAFVNPLSRANRRDPALIERLRTALGSAGRVLAPATLEELAEAARSLAAAPPAVVAVHGGDGTLHKVLTALLAAWRDSAAGAPLPALAILPGGTMNVVASSLNVLTDAEEFLAALAADIQRDRPPQTLSRRCLRFLEQPVAEGTSATERHGFVFGNGAIASFLEEYYSTGAYGAPRALWLAARLVTSVPVRGEFSERVLRHYRGQTVIDGVPVPRDELLAVTASTVREVGLGFKLNHRADESLERFSVVAVHGGPASVLLDVPGVFGGRGLSPANALTRVATSLALTGADGPMTYTIDGDLYTAPGPLRVEMGPLLSFVRPPPGRPRAPTGLLARGLGDKFARAAS